MKTISIHETDTSLLISNRISYGVKHEEPEEFIIPIYPQRDKEDVTHSIKLNAFRGKLFVTVETVYAGDLTFDYHNSVNSCRIIPHMPGKMVGFILPENVPVINAFLDKHFPEVEAKPLTSDELDEMKELSFLHNHQEQRYKAKKIESLSDFSEPRDTVISEDSHKIAEVIARISSIAFPVYDFFDISRLNDGFYYVGYLPMENLRKHHYAKDLREFLTALFGVYRKDLARVAVKKQMLQLYWAAKFVGILDMDTIIASLDKMKYSMEHDWFDMQILEEFPRKIKRMLLEDVKYSESVIVRDALEMAPWIPAEKRKKCFTWSELHDIGMFHYSIDGTAIGDIEPPEELNRFYAEAKFEGLSVEPLMNPEHFITTGAEMKVCVGSMPYITNAVEDKGYCFRLNKPSGEAEALVEIIRSKHEDPNKWIVNQVRGAQNARVDDELQKTISEELSKYIKL